MREKKIARTTIVGGGDEGQAERFHGLWRALDSAVTSIDPND